MYFDALTLSAVIAEFHATILGGRIQRVLLPGPLSIGLEVYAQRQRYQLLASAHPQYARVHLVQNKLSRGVEQASPLLLLLRKYVLGGRITAIEQPPLERIVVVSIVKEVESRNYELLDASQMPDEVLPDRDEVEDEESLLSDHQIHTSAHPSHALSRILLRSELIIEPMDRRSNIILVDDNNLILDSVKRVTPQMSHRVILPRHVYELPPRQERRDPHTATPSDMQVLLDSGAATLSRALISSYRGVSPLVAREVIQRAMGVSDSEVCDNLPWDALATHLRNLFSPPWHPHLVPGSAGPQAYAPYHITHMHNAQPQPDISSALEAFYASREAVTAHQQYRTTIMQRLDATRERLSHQQQQLEAEMQRAGNLERLRWEGEMIFAFLHSITPGQQYLDIDGDTIKLNPNQSPVETARDRFRAYEKARKAIAGIPERLHETNIRLDGLEQLATLLELANTREQIAQIEQEAHAQGYLQTPQRGPATSKSQPASQRRTKTRIKPLHLLSSDGFDLYIGRSSEENAAVTFRIGRPDDLWLHGRAIPGAHVIIRCAGQDVPEQTLREAAGLAAYFSRSRQEKLVDVDLARRSRVRKIAGAAPGLVTYTAEQSLRVAPLPPWK